MMRYSFGIEILMTTGRVTMLLEQDSAVRRIYTDGRGHSEDPELTFSGESIGRWEGDTLIVDTTAIHPKSEMIAGVPISGKTHIVERIRLIDPDHLQIETTVEDPVALVSPWKSVRTYDRSSAGVFERICLENNRDIGAGDPDLNIAE